MLNKFIRCKTLICKNKNYFHHHYPDLKQNNIESVGNTNPNSREINSKDFFKENQMKFDDLSDNRQELSNWLIKCCYTKKEDKISYLEEKHKKYNDNDNDNDIDV